MSCVCDPEGTRLASRDAYTLPVGQVGCGRAGPVGWASSARGVRRSQAEVREQGLGSHFRARSMRAARDGGPRAPVQCLPLLPPLPHNPQLCYRSGPRGLPRRRAGRIRAAVLHVGPHGRECMGGRVCVWLSACGCVRDAVPLTHANAMCCLSSNTLRLRLGRPVCELLF